MSKLEQIRLGISQTFPCSYIDGEQETLLLCCQEVSSKEFEQLLAFGFRRSGDQIYRPHCRSCDACVPVRVLVEQFQPSRSQKRVIAKNRDVTWSVSEQVKPEYFEMYHRYIASRHQDGSMYPPSDEQFEQFLITHKYPAFYLEGRIGDHLIAVAVTDILDNSLSATYTFFEPTMASRSLGKRAIIAQIELAKTMKRRFLYLGYQIDSCNKMAYKKEFTPIQMLAGGRWRNHNIQL